jgi:hypothetical protein
VVGKPTNAIAREAGCTPRHAQRLASEPETQFLITEALRPHRKRLERMAAHAIRVVDSGLRANKKTPIDHFTRLRAVERYADLMQLAQGKKTEDLDANRPMVTWEEFIVLYHSRGSSNASDTVVPAPVG